MDELFENFGLKEAKEVLLKGCSAGGMAVYLHADYVGERIREHSSKVRYAAAPGAGMFLDQKAFLQNASFTTYLKWSYEAQNVSGSTNAACEAAHAGSSDGYLCYLAPHVLPYVSTPLFISNSLTDSCALEYLMEIGCDPLSPGNCSQGQLSYISQYRANMLGILEPVFKANSRHGGFLQSCWNHIVEDDSISWGSTRVQNQTQSQTFSAWWKGSGAPHTLVVDGEWGSNPTCSNLGGCD